MPWMVAELSGSGAMATAELTLDQILDTVRHWPAARQQTLVRALAELPTPEQALVAARRLRGRYRLTPKQRRRMSALLAKGNAGTLTAAEKRELDRLVEQFETKTLELARAIAGDGNRPGRRPTRTGPESA